MSDYADSYVYDSCVMFGERGWRQRVSIKGDGEVRAAGGDPYESRRENEEDEGGVYVCSGWAPEGVYVGGWREPKQWRPARAFIIMIILDIPCPKQGQASLRNFPSFPFRY